MPLNRTLQVILDQIILVITVYTIMGMNSKSSLDTYIKFQASVNVI